MNLTLVKKEKFNTNNGWGFGGGYGNEYTYSNGLVNRKGKLCYRHAGTSPLNNWYILVDGNKESIGGWAVKTGMTIYKIEYMREKGDNDICYYAARTANDAKGFFKKSKIWGEELITIQEIITV
jgi:hypothetical protein